MMHCERLIRALVYPNPMSRMTFPFQHHVNALSIPFPPFGAASSHRGQLSQIPNRDPNLSAGLKTYLVYYAEEMDRTSSCERSRSLTRRASLETITLERRSWLPAHLDLPILIPRNNPAEQHKTYHHHHSKHIPLPLLRHFPQLLVPRGQWEHPRVLIPPLLNGGLVLCAGCAVCLFSIQTVSIRDIVATTTSITGTTSRHNNITVMQAACWTRFLFWITVHLLN
ncbi:hypothetical protein F4604DRAFT_1810542 [Suillus subluteus]|nr:hypothetical protein F4604DRAFT_1810542 [Suillus subluteus]